MPFDTVQFIEELQNRPEIYNPTLPGYHTKRKDKLKELGALFNMSGRFNHRSIDLWVQ